MVDVNKITHRLSPASIIQKRKTKRYTVSHQKILEIHFLANFTLFLIHGIGVHKEPSWADKTIEVMTKAWHQDVGLNTQISDHIDVVPISYDSVFEDYLDDFSDLSQAVLGDVLDLPRQEKLKLSQTFTDQKINKRHVLWSHVVDVLLYKMQIVREQVTACVAEQIYAAISHKSGAHNFGIVAHSLGTRVINDTLQRIKTSEPNQGNFYQQGYKLKFLMLISDVTTLFGLPLNRDPHPPKDVYPRGTFDYLRTVSNRYDPIARIIPTRLDYWPEGRTDEMYMGRPLYKDILLDHVHETNVHGLTHYMMHPEITSEIFNLCGFTRHLRMQTEEFPPVGPQVNPELKTALEQLMDSAKELADNSWQTYVNLVIKFRAFSHPHEIHTAHGEHPNV